MHSKNRRDAATVRELRKTFEDAENRWFEAGMGSSSSSATVNKELDVAEEDFFKFLFDLVPLVTLAERLETARVELATADENCRNFPLNGVFMRRRDVAQKAFNELRAEQLEEAEAEVKERRLDMDGLRGAPDEVWDAAWASVRAAELVVESLRAANEVPAGAAQSVELAMEERCAARQALIDSTTEEDRGAAQERLKRADQALSAARSVTGTGIGGVPPPRSGLPAPAQSSLYTKKVRSTALLEAPRGESASVEASAGVRKTKKGMQELDPETQKNIDADKILLKTSEVILLNGQNDPSKAVDPAWLEVGVDQFSKLLQSPHGAGVEDSKMPNFKHVTTFSVMGTDGLLHDVGKHIKSTLCCTLLCSLTVFLTPRSPPPVPGFLPAVMIMVARYATSQQLGHQVSAGVMKAYLAQEIFPDPVKYKPADKDTGYKPDPIRGILHHKLANFLMYACDVGDFAHNFSKAFSIKVNHGLRCYLHHPRHLTHAVHIPGPQMLNTPATRLTTMETKGMHLLKTGFFSPHHLEKAKEFAEGYFKKHDPESDSSRLYKPYSSDPKTYSLPAGSDPEPEESIEFMIEAFAMVRPPRARPHLAFPP